jgi:hypothetical protein
MKRMLLPWIIAGAVVTATAASRGGATDISGLAWLTGCWASETGDAGSGEQWMAPAGGSLLGMSRTVRDGRTVAYEFLRISATDDGSLTYTAQPSGQAEATFTLVSLGDSEVVFENPHHDFPQRIVYRVDQGVLQARAEGWRGDRHRVVHFPMQRASCEAVGR